MIRSVIFLVCFLKGQSLPLESTFQNSTQKVKTEWLVNDLVKENPKKVRILGSPETILCKYGKALLFNGTTDGIFLDSLPLKDLKKFTIEAIIRPDSGGNVEQRFFHCGEVRGDRVLMETRSSPTNWYLDAFIKSADNTKVCLDSTLLHPLKQWYHIAFVADKDKINTYVNGIKEFSCSMNFLPLISGKTSIGVRLNELSWFKGAIYKIRISSIALTPDKFMNH